VKHPSARSSLLAMLAVALLVLAACASTPTNTRLTGDDLNETTRLMAESLAGSKFFADRSPTSPPVYVVINKVENLTSDIIPPAEQWMLMARIQGAMPIRQLGKNSRVYFIIPPERESMAASGGYKGDFSHAPAGITPTHVLKAVYRSSTRTVRDSDGNVKRRQDYYTLQYQLTDITGREVVWTDSFEFKRQTASGGIGID
jgi:hypothetical protein